MIKLIAIDLDGTLLNDDKKVSTKNYQALKSAHEKGIKIVLCTGRPYMAMRGFVEELDFLTDDDYIVTFNGGIIHKAVDGEVVVRETMSQPEMLAWYEEAQRLDLPFNVIDEDYIYEPLSYPAGHESLYMKQIGQVDAPSMVKDFYEFDASHKFNKFIIAVEPDYLAQQRKKINPDMTEEYALTLSLPHLLEIGTKNINKGNGLKKLGQILGIKTNEMLTIGDEANDLSMIEMAGIGVAMENAIPEIKKAADYITASNNDSGVARAIENFIS